MQTFNEKPQISYSVKKQKQVVKHTSTTNLYHHHNTGQRERVT